MADLARRKSWFSGTNDRPSAHWLVIKITAHPL
jgi:hypothetical protein